MHLSEYQRIEKLENVHFWYRAMEEISLELINIYTKKKNLKILDAGCGTAGMTKKLEAFGGETIGIDINPKALALAKKKRIKTLIQADVCHLPFGDNEFDVVASFDVIYHRDVTNDEKAIKEMYRVLKPEGLLIVRVPAFEFLRGAHDQVVATRHRYKASELKEKMEKAGFQIIRLTYANMLLSIPLLIKRSIERLKKNNSVSSDTVLLPYLINELFYYILKGENSFLRFFSLPFGSSIICLGGKK